MCPFICRSGIEEVAQVLISLFSSLIRIDIVLVLAWDSPANAEYKFAFVLLFSKSMFLPPEKNFYPSMNGKHFPYTETQDLSGEIFSQAG